MLTCPVGLVMHTLHVCGDIPYMYVHGDKPGWLIIITLCGDKPGWLIILTYVVACPVGHIMLILCGGMPGWAGNTYPMW